MHGHGSQGRGITAVPEESSHRQTSSLEVDSNFKFQSHSNRSLKKGLAGHLWTVIVFCSRAGPGPCERFEPYGNAGPVGAGNAKQGTSVECLLLKTENNAI
jgi:hypothetical protein